MNKGVGGHLEELDSDLVADLKAHRTPEGGTMVSPTTLHIGRPWDI